MDANDTIATRGGTLRYLVPAPFSFSTVIAAIVVCFVWYTMFNRTGNEMFKAPIIGPEDTIRARWQFFRNASTFLNEGYKKYKGKIFKLSGHDILVLPSKYITELRSMPDEELSSIQANIDNFEGLYSTTAILTEGNLHTRTIQSRLTPRLRHHVPVVQEVLNRHFPEELPATKYGYSKIKGFHLILRLVSFIAARHFVGSPLCEDEEWLSVALTYTENAFKTIIVLRIFPDWAKLFVAVFLPFSYQVSWALRKAKRIVIPLIEERRKREREDPNHTKPEDFLQYMMDGAGEFDGQPDKLAHRLLILTLAAVHTTSMAATQTLFDLCAHPEYIEPLRQEVLEVLQSEGGYTKQTLTHFKKLDSFMRESQRLNPPSLLGFKRAVRKPLTLSDGTYLPKGVHLMMPIAPVVLDPEVTPNPYTFDGLRHYHNRDKPGEAHKHQFATTSDDNLHFGHGKYSCPGRFLAGNSVKMIISNILLRYDLRYPEGVTTRPPNVCLHEYVFPNPEAEIEFMRRDEKSEWIDD
ncbi:putative cytochrome P450 monooxygenase [Daldinia vernicosa]|uniref:putative cytochrome P450 monooxygenase n=1 Tax=Daldinia vernicosa TaxID=114800 RepID=UPI00200751A5|nr:putative cytochrome P450 monooxygenase [Daldinia vernicosa]KAI0850466.1 putative cytochrome P450 monooxygenase [Daldinia vernicosa]